MTRAVQVRHAGIVVADLERSLRFYKDFLGLEVQRRMLESGDCIDNVLALPGVEVETVKLGFDGEATQVELLFFRSHSVETFSGVRTLQAGPTHIAFTVDNLRTLYTRMSEMGVEFNSPPQSSPDGKVLLAYCKDPDGGLVELVEIL